jgi:hypothetical protein
MRSTNPTIPDRAFYLLPPPVLLPIGTNISLDNCDPVGYNCRWGVAPYSSGRVTRLLPFSLARAGATGAWSKNELTLPFAAKYHKLYSDFLPIACEKKRS